MLSNEASRGVSRRAEAVMDVVKAESASAGGIDNIPAVRFRRGEVGRFALASILLLFCSIPYHLSVPSADDSAEF